MDVLRDKADKVYDDLGSFPNGISRLVKVLKLDCRVAGRCMKCSRGKLCISRKEGFIFCGD